MAMKKIMEDVREHEVKGEYDVVVVCGGPAGISASIAGVKRKSFREIFPSRKYLAEISS